MFNDFSIVSSPPFLFFHLGGWGQIWFRHSFSQLPLVIRPPRPTCNRQEHQTSSCIECTHNIPYQTSNITLYTQSCTIAHD